MTLEQLFPILMQYAPIMLDAIQNRGYDPGVMANNANDLTEFWYNESLPSFAERVSDPTMMKQINALDRNFEYILDDSDHPNDVFNDLIPHSLEYSLDDIIANDNPMNEFEDYLEYPNKLNALGYAKQMFNK